MIGFSSDVRISSRKIETFEREQSAIRALDRQGEATTSKLLYRQYQIRNSFGLDLNKKIHRIFQEDYLKSDLMGGCITLPKASAAIWGDELENPFACVKDVDPVTHGSIDLGALVRSFHAICWTSRSNPEESDWLKFSHGKNAVRITTSVGKLMDRMMCVSDPNYMHRSWLVEVDYEPVSIIEAMMNPQEVYSRLESQGALLALSAAVVRTKFSEEDEVRLLFDASRNLLPTMHCCKNPSLIQIPFEWNDFIEEFEYGPRSG